MVDAGKPLVVKCPQCKHPVPWTRDQMFKPFCSERCKLIDLGEWAAEEKRIAGEPVYHENGIDETFYH